MGKCVDNLINVDSIQHMYQINYIFFSYEQQIIIIKNNSLKHIFLQKCQFNLLL